MKEVNHLRITNSIIWGLSIVGGAIITIFGIFFGGGCVDEGYGTCYDYAGSPVLIAYGITAILISTLVAQVIYLFAAHVEASHKA